MSESMLTQTGVIYNIQRYSLHDGPGIRTNVFLKGCPLKCFWCANPESQETEIQQMGSETIGKVVTVEEVIDSVARDNVFYKRSGGGMTLTGGEPLMQHQFAAALVAEAKKKDIHITIETSGYQNWDQFWNVVKDIDLLLFDIKAMDSVKHKELVGVPNQLILDNAKRAAELGKEIIFRVPVIPGYNDSTENLLSTARFGKEIGVKEINLLPYHRLGEFKYEKLGRKYELEGVKAPSKESLREIALKIQQECDIPILVI